MLTHGMSAIKKSLESGLLIILSQGSDPLSMNDHYEKVFDAISTVHHNKNDKQVCTRRTHTLRISVLVEL